MKFFYKYIFYNVVTVLTWLRSTLVLERVSSKRFHSMRLTYRSSITQTRSTYRSSTTRFKNTLPFEKAG